MFVESIKLKDAESESEYSSTANKQKEQNVSAESGFSLIEATTALVIFLIATIGVYTTFTYSINFNAGNSTRAQSLALLQQEVEQMRSAKFTNGTPPDSILTGGVKIERILPAPDGNNYRIQTTVDDDPFTPGVQVDSTKTLKEITITVYLDRPSPGWQTAIPATIILRRVRGN